MVNLCFRANELGVEDNRWIASLSDGTTVFEDRIPNAPSAWIRLQQYVKENGLKITCLRLQVRGILVQLPSRRDDNGIVQVDGYWHSKQIEAVLDHRFPQKTSYGIGFIRGNNLSIKWIRENGAIEDEVREYNRKNDLAGILNDEAPINNDPRDSA